MVDISGQVIAPRGVDCAFVIHVEQVTAAATVGFLGADAFAGVLDDTLTGAQRHAGEQAEATTAATKTEPRLR
jgi:hypothetical protein